MNKLVEPCYVVLGGNNDYTDNCRLLADECDYVDKKRMKVDLNWNK